VFSISVCRRIREDAADFDAERFAGQPLERCGVPGGGPELELGVA
jgi:hypothetical protein